MSSLLAAVLATPAQAQTAPSASTESVSAAGAAVAVSTPTAAPEEIPGVTPARPWVIGDIAVQGNKNVKFGTVRGAIKARKGNLYDRPDLDRDIQSLLGLGNFERVAADITDVDDGAAVKQARAPR